MTKDGLCRINNVTVGDRIYNSKARRSLSHNMAVLNINGRIGDAMWIVFSCSMVSVQQESHLLFNDLSGSQSIMSLSLCLSQWHCMWCNGSRARSISWARAPVGSIHLETIKLVFVASPLSTQHKRERANTGWLGIRIMCASGVICLSVDFWFSELALKNSN